MVKICERKLRKYGGGLSLAIPPVWIKDLVLQAGDSVAIYRDDEDRLIIARVIKK